MSKRTVVAGILTAVTVAGVAAAFFMCLTGDPYLGLFGYMVGIWSGVTGVAALLSWAWGRPLQQVLVMVLGGTLVGGAMIYGSMYGAFSISDSRRAAKSEKQQQEDAKAYGEAKAYRFSGATYEPQKNKLVVHQSSNLGPPLHSAVVVPITNEFVLIIDGRDAYVFDGVSSIRVEFDGADLGSETIGAGKFAFRGKYYSVNTIHFAHMEFGRDAGGDPPYMNPKLVGAIAPIAKTEAGKSP